MLTMLATGADEDTAKRALERSGFQVKVAILAIARSLPIDEAQARLDAARGNLRLALSS
jgi:N-acetylmuramic acid 6-phosphate etherase